MFLKEVSYAYQECIDQKYSKEMNASLLNESSITVWTVW